MYRLFLLLLVTSWAHAQRDSGSVGIPLVGVHVGGQLPHGDLAARFGPNLATGGAFMFKTRSSWLFGADGSYLFGRNVREDVLKQLRNEDGFVLDNEGYPADLRVTERGVMAHLIAGKILPWLRPNPNSGILVMAGIGALQHRVKLYDANQKVAAVRGDLAAGYDRLSLGLSGQLFVGYLFLSEYRMLNFYAGVEYYQASTKSVRGYNYDTGQRDDQRRTDGLTGFRFGWILPLYKKVPDEYYYY